MKSCAIGTICALMLTFSRENLKKITYTIYIKNISTFYCRFIDDIFCLCNGTKSELIELTVNPNKKHPTIKVEFTYSKTSITSLDTNIYKNQNGILCTTVYRKSNDPYMFLP